MSTRQQTRTSGPFKSGEAPLPFTVKFDPIDIDFTGFTLAATMAGHSGAEMTFTGTVTWSDITKGIVQVDFAVLDLQLAAGVEHEDRLLAIWATDGTNLIASLDIKVPIDMAVGTPPELGA
jgi:hypothetical protein